ncbi:MAG: transglycosylase domain-containing protein [Methylacidiphilales bacterium]|nr:transglycosylase domain-containing protein [Candidatus Methylacidiphilales bacterium]
MSAFRRRVGKSLFFLDWIKRHPFAKWVLVLLLAVPAAFFLYYSIWALSFDMEKISHMPETTILYDRHGYVIQRLYDENRILIRSSQIPDVLRKAVIAKEDERFLYHPGFDPIAITRALFINLFKGRISSGASTITQQLARNSAGMFARTFDRKLREAFLALRIEFVFSKDQILTFYLNRIYFGGNLYGIGAAADAYFGKTPDELNLSESAMLAGIIAGPNSFSPWKNPAKAREARAKVLERMVNSGYINQKTADACNRQPLTLRPLMDKPGSYVTAAALAELPSFLTQDYIYRGGLRIFTTIDLAFQKAAEQNIESSLSNIERMSGYAHTTRAQYLAGRQSESETPDYLQAAFVAISNADGGILAIVGGRNFDESPYNRAMLARRQIGSTVKPFVYSNAFNTLDFTAFTEIDHSTFDLRKPDDTVVPVGPDPEFITVRQALERSDNYAAMRTGLSSGLDNFCYLFEQATGVRPQAFPSSLLGSCEVSPFELATAYTIFPNLGVRIKPHLIDKIETHDGVLVFQHTDERKRVLSPQIAFQISHLLQGIVDNGTAQLLRSEFGLTGDIGGKTGTTNEYRDSWFAGYTSEITAAIWIGLDHPKTVIPGGYAARLAVPTWASIMKLANDNYKPRPLAPPPGVSLQQQKKEEKVFFFFSKSSVSGQSEYVRDDQRNNALARLDQNTSQALAEMQNPAKPWWQRAVDVLWKPDPDEPQPANTDNPDNPPPKAQPVD